MIETGFDARVKVQQIIENQLPEFILDESPRTVEFLKQYYISQEFQSGNIDIAENLDQYLKLDNLTPEVVKSSTTLLGDINSTVGVVTISSIKSLPPQYGLIKIDDEIITYTGLKQNKFSSSCSIGIGTVRVFVTNPPDQSYINRPFIVDSLNNSSTIVSIGATYIVLSDILINSAGTLGFSSLGTYSYRTDKPELTGCVRGFSGITSYHRVDNPGELEFSTSKADSHTKGSFVENLSSLFLREFYKKIKYTLTPGLENVDFVENLDVSNFIKQSRVFYQSKGTEESFRILFNVLFGETPKVIDLETKLIKPSYADFSRRNVIVCQRISGNPLNLVGQTVTSSKNPDLKASVSSVEVLTRKGQTYYTISLFIGYDSVDSTQGTFSVPGKTKILEPVSVGSSIITVDSTIGFDDSGVLILGANTVNYTSKSVNQFFGCTGISVGISTSAEDVRSEDVLYGYENGDTSKKCEVRITGVLSKFISKDDILSVKKGEIIRVQSLGEVIKSPSNNKTYKEIFANSWIYNTSSSYEVKSISSSNFTVQSEIDKSSLKIGDSVQVVVRGTQNVVASNATISDINYSLKVITLNNLGAASGIATSNLLYDIRRKVSKAYSSGAELQYGNNNILANVQNVYNESDEYCYVASNSLPSYEITKNIISSSIPVALQPALQGYDILLDKYSIISFPSNVDFLTGDAVLYESENSEIPMPGLESGEIYYVETLTLPNQIRLYSSRSFIGNVDDLGNPTNYLVFGKLFTGSGKHTFTYNPQRDKVIGPQKLLRKFPLIAPKNIRSEQETTSGSVGILANGVEISNYKSNDKIYYGPLELIEIINSGKNYDVINPPIISISSPDVGTQAYVSPVISGIVTSVLVDPQDFDIEKVLSVTISGGNGSGCILQPVVSDRYRELEFDGRSNISGGGVDITDETISFYSPHYLQNGEEIIYNSNGNLGIGIGKYGSPDIINNKIQDKTLISDSSYFAKVVTDKSIRLYYTLNDYNSGINTVGFTTENSGGIHKFRTLNKKTLNKIVVINSGSNYQNRRLYIKASNIDIVDNKITFSNYNFNEGDLVQYETTGTIISGLSTSNQYYILKVDNNTFKLADAGSGLTPSTLDYERRKPVNLQTVGSGYHIFKYPDIQVNINVSYGSSIVGVITSTPYVRGKIIDAYLYESGSGYGSNILNIQKKPTISIKNGKDAVLKLVVRETKIIKVDVLSGGSEYYSTPDLIISGPGSGAIIRPIISNGKIAKVVVINPGINYDQNLTSIRVSPAGTNGIVDCRIRSLTVNSAYRNSNEILVGTPLNKLEYAIVGYSTITGNTGKSAFGDTGVAHSPIIGWAYDGNPIYGPWAYSDPSNTSEIKILETGYTLDTSNVTNRPSGFPAGFFTQDYKFDESGDLDTHNGRFCKTPDFPNGVYAYFAGVSIDLQTNTLKPQFPYFIGNTYRNEFIADNQYLNQSFDFNNSKLIRNTFPYKVNDEYAGNDFLIESNEITTQLSIVESSLKGQVDSLKVINAGSNYKIGDSLQFVNDANDTEGSGLSAKVSSLTGKDIQKVETTVSEYYGSIFVWKNENEVLVKTPTYHNIIKNDNVVVSGLSTSITNLFGVKKVGLTSESFYLFKSMASNAISGFVTDIYASNIPGSVSVGSSLQIGNEIVSVLNIFPENSVIRVERSSAGVAHTISSLVGVLPNTLTLTSKLNYFDSKINNRIHFNPKQSVGVGTTTGYSNQITYTVGETVKTVSIPTQSIYLPNHPFNNGDRVTIHKEVSTLALVVGLTTSGSTFSLPTPADPILFPDSANTGTVYIINKGKDYIGLTTVLSGVSSTSGGLYFFSNGTDNYKYYLENQYNQVTGNIQKIITTVSISTAHELQTGDIINLTVKPNIPLGIGDSTSVRVKYDSLYNKVLINTVGFGTTSINTVSNTITINNHGFKNGDKIFYNSTDLIASGLTTGGYFVYKIDNNSFQLAETKVDIRQNYPNIVNIVSIGGTGHQISLINPELFAIKNSNLFFDLSDPSLLGYKLKIYYDNQFTNEFISDGTSEYFNISGISTVGVGQTASLTVSYDDNLPTKLFYNLEKNGSKVILDYETSNYGQITYVDSKYNGSYPIVSAGATIFRISPLQQPERSLYTRFECDTLKYTTNSTNAKGGIDNLNIISGGSNYSFLPKLSNINTNQGQDADIITTSNSIGKLNKVRIIDQGFEYSSDKTLRPQAYTTPLVNIVKSNTLDNVNVVYGGKNYSFPPDLILYDPLENNVVNVGGLTADITSTAISKVNILTDINGLNSVTHKVIAVNNTNGVAISSVTSSASGIVTYTLATPFITGFLSPPFSAGDQVFIEGVEKENTQGTGFNSENYNYDFFTVVTYENTNPAKLEVDYSTLTSNVGTAKTNQSAYATVVNKNNYPIFSPEQKFSLFTIGESLITNTGTGFIQRDLIVTESKKEYIKISGSYDLKDGEVIKGKTSDVLATVLNVVKSKGEYVVDYAIERDYGWNNDFGKLNEDYQFTSDNDYYQNLSYTVKSSKTYSEIIDPVNRLLHTSGLKNFADTQIESSASLSYDVNTTTQIVLDIVEENRVDTLNNFDLVVDTNTSNNKSKFLKLANKKLSSYIKCISNNVLLLDDISDGFSNKESVSTLYSDIKLLTDSYYRFLIQITDPVSLNKELTELIILATDKNIYTMQKGSVSTTGESFGELEGSIDGFDVKSLRFTPLDLYDTDYDIKSLENNFNSNNSGIGTNSIGFVNLTGSNKYVGIGSTEILFVDDVSDVELLVANVEIRNLVNNKSSYVELFVENNGQDTYMAEYYFNNIPGITTNFMGSFNPRISLGKFYLDYTSNETQDLLVRSKITTFGATTSGIGTYRYILPGQIPGNERTAYYEANFATSSSPSTIFSCNKTYCASAKSLVRVSYGNSSAVHQVLSVFNGDNVTVEQYPYVSVAATSGIGTFGAESTLTNIVLKFYPDSSITTPVKVQSYNEILYTINDYDNTPAELIYGPVSERIDLATYESVNGDRLNKTEFELTYNNIPVLMKTFNPVTSINKETGLITISNHFFRPYERLIYRAESTFVGIASTALGIGSTANSSGIVTSILPSEVYVVPVSTNTFKLSTRLDYAKAGIYVTFTSYGSGNAHKLEMYKSLEKSLIAINGVVQKPITYTPIAKTLKFNGGQVSIASSVFALSGISSIKPTDVLKIDNEYMGILDVGYSQSPTGPISGIGTFEIVNVERGYIGSDAAAHLDGSVVKIYRGSYNISKNIVNFTQPPRGRGYGIDNTNIPFPVSQFEGRVYLRDDYTNNIIYDDISDEFTGLGQTFRIKVQGINTTAIEPGSGVLFINDIFQTPTTANNSGNNYEINTSTLAGISSVTFTGITSTNGNLVKSLIDINQNQLPRGGLIVSLGSTQGLGFAPLVGASVTAIVGAGGSIVSVGLGSTSIFGSGYNHIPTIKVYQPGHAGIGSTAIITASVGAGGTLSFNVSYGGTGYTNPIIQIPDPSYQNLPVIGVSRRGIGNTTDTGTGLLLNLNVGPIGQPSPISGRNADASRLIILNKTLIAEVAVGRMLTAYPGFTVPNGNQKCINDIITVLERIAYNLSYGGNDQVYDAAKIYITNGYLAGEEQQSIYAFHQARDMAIQSMRNVSISINGYSLLSQIFDYNIVPDPATGFNTSPASCSNIASAITQFVGIVTNAVGVSTLPGSRTGIGASLFEVSSFSISRPGYGFKIGDVFKPVGLVTARGLSSPVRNFELTVLDTFTDAFSLWQFGELDYIDSIKNLQDGVRTRFPLYYNSQLLSFEIDPQDAQSSTIDLDSVLLIFLNGVLQEPKYSYTFTGGTSFIFSTPPKPEDNISIFFYRGTRDTDSAIQLVKETAKIGDNLQVSRNNQIPETVPQLTRRIDDIPGSDLIQTNIYSYLGVDSQNLKPVNWTKQKVDQNINGENIYKTRDSIEPLIFPTAKIIKNIGYSDQDLFLDNAQFFRYEESQLAPTNIISFDSLVIGNTDNLVSAGVSAIVSTSGTVSGLIITDPGSGYIGTSLYVKISNPKKIGVGIGTTASARVSIVNGKVSNPILISNPGYGYTVAPKAIVEDPPFTYELITDITTVEGFSGIITGIGTTTGIGGHPLAINFFANVSTNDFTGLISGYPIYISDTNVGHGVTSVINSDSDTVGVGTTFLNNIYYISNINVQGQNAKITCNVNTNLRRTGITISGGNIENPYGKFSWGRLSILNRSSNPISIGVTGLKVDSGLTTFPSIQRRGYGLRDTGALKKRPT
jgi:hypothetical protein